MKQTGTLNQQPAAVVLGRGGTILTSRELHSFTNDLLIDEKSVSLPPCKSAIICVRRLLFGGDLAAARQEIRHRGDDECVNVTLETERGIQRCCLGDR